MTREEISSIKITPPSNDIFFKIKSEWDSMAKPLDGMGDFEEITARIGAILGTKYFDINKKAVVIMCADNGIVEEGISQSGQDVTLSVSVALGKGISTVNRLANSVGADVVPVDVGINSDSVIYGVLNKKVMRGTKNFLKEPAMTEDEALKAISVGIEMARFCKDRGYSIIATGEMGIGNTTTSSAVLAAITGSEAEKVTGRGAGLSDEKLFRKYQVIREAMKKYRFDENDTLRILSTVGGLDIAGMAGLYIGGAKYGIPVVIDGLISSVAALVAGRLIPGVEDYMIASHLSREPAAEIIMKKLKLTPIINAGMSLGEGTGAVMMFALLEAAMALYKQHSVFSDISVEQYERY